MTDIQISLYTALLIALSLALTCVICLVIGYALGRNSAERPIVRQKEPRKLREDEIVTQDGEGDYIMDEIEDFEPPLAGRIPTM